VLDARKRGEAVAERAVELFRALGVKSAKARVHFKHEIIFNAQARLE
jgi:hypothetical protein